MLIQWDMRLFRLARPLLFRFLLIVAFLGGTSRLAGGRSSRSGRLSSATFSSYILSVTFLLQLPLTATGGEVFFLPQRGSGAFRSPAEERLCGARPFDLSFPRIFSAGGRRP
jgi:hypothetical protein